MKEDSLLGGRYELLEQIGAGGEARVFHARDRQLATEVAVRMPLPGQTSPAGAPSSRPQSHPGWVQMLGEGIDAQRGPYQVFELLQGETLHQQIRRGPMDEAAWLTFVRQSLEAVEALHAAGWVHGDLNAENFLLSNAPAGPWKLLELPFLRLGRPAGRSALFGSIHTLAPEQLNGQMAGAPADLYALGCLYYYAAAGEYPHSGATSQEVAISRLRFPAGPLGEKAPQLPVALSGWVMKLLERDAGRRPPGIPAARQLLATL